MALIFAINILQFAFKATIIAPLPSLVNQIKRREFQHQIVHLIEVKTRAFFVPLDPNFKCFLSHLH